MWGRETLFPSVFLSVSSNRNVYFPRETLDIFSKKEITIPDV